jgi:DNA helicase II / ATP-dependent DNA helicase PcrA
MDPSPSGALKTSLEVAAAVVIPGGRTTASFEAEYAKLNEAQKAAVETIEGPLMVVAGPGTGKTQVVALRVANILRKTQARPSNILCLTFSSSGATAMRERLRGLIGPDAYGASVNTIHGFCNEIIQQNPHVFEEFSALEQISDVERFRSVNKIIDGLLPDLVLVNRKSPYTRTKDIIDRISLMKREGKTLEELYEAADAYEIQMAGKSKEGTKAHEKNMLSARKFREFVKVFGKYQEMMAETQRYDYDDMILNVIRAMKEEDWLLATLQERYHYVIVDEFQDTNGAQAKVIELLTTYVSGDAPNLCVVGDDDQAIYRFQGANLQNILSFRSRFPRADVIVLKTSYRCLQEVLDCAGSLIGQNTERLVGKIDGLTKDLTAFKGSGVRPRLIRTASDVTEPWAVAEIVEDAIARGIPPNEIAILAQKNKELPVHYEVLKAKGIPVQMTGKLDLLNHPLVRQALSILKGVQKPGQDGHLAAALSCECFGCHPADLGRLFRLRREEEQSLLDLLLSWNDETSLLKDIPWIRKDALVAARDGIMALHQQLPNRTIVQTLEHVLKDCGLLPVPTPDGKHTIDLVDFAALQAFFDRIRYRAYEQTGFSFETLMSDLEFYRKEEYGDLKMSYQLPHLSDEGVQLMTAHHSKGLEFDIVILPHFREGHWDKKKTPSSLSIPEDILFGWNKEIKDYEKGQDERRVAYVAMTRAKKELYFTCPKQIVSADKSKDVAPSAFFAEAGSAADEEEREVKDPLQISTLLLKPPRHLDLEFRAFLKERIESFALSPTALSHFLEDPQMFLLRDLLQVPEVKDSSLVYGNAAHSALRTWALRMQEGMPLGREDFLGEFQNYLVDREILTADERRNLMEHGRENLLRYYDQRLAGKAPYIHKIEYPINTHFGDIPLKGKIDRIDLASPDSAIATVIDFKTGRPQTEGEIRNGDYYRQLTFYALLLDLLRSPLKPNVFILDFIGEGADHPVERTFQIGDADKEELKKLITDVWGKITALDFTPL